MSAAIISGHLVTDWVPSLPAETGTSFIGWPSFLLETVRVASRDLLALRVQAGRSERQWKSFLSWMLGVAGARHILRDEGYRWIAPLSAFYPDAVAPVDLTRWNGSFPPSSLTAESNPRNSSLVRPDYVALRSTSAAGGSRSDEWAVAEAKGTSFSLANWPVCPSEWSAQVRNVVLKLNGSKIPIPRHIVIATRVNPNATKPRTRRIQLRAWNKREENEISGLPAEAAVLISAAHLFGVFKGLRLPNNAATIALAVSARRNGFTDKQFHGHIQQASERAEQELLARTQQGSAQPGIGTSPVLSLDTERGTVMVQIAEPLLRWARTLRHTTSPDEASRLLRKIDAELDVWEASRQAAGQQDQAVYSAGIEMRFPNDFEPRHRD